MLSGPGAILDHGFANDASSSLLTDRPALSYMHTHPAGHADLFFYWYLEWLCLVQNGQRSSDSTLLPYLHLIVLLVCTGGGSFGILTMFPALFHHHPRPFPGNSLVRVTQGHDHMVCNTSYNDANIHLSFTSLHNVKKGTKSISKWVLSTNTKGKVNVH